MSPLCLSFSFFSSGAIFCMPRIERIWTMASGRMARRTQTVRMMIDQAHGTSGRLLDAEEEPVEQILERGENAAEDDVHRGLTGSTGSCCENGWQWLSRRSASSEPRSAPCVRIACSA